MKRGLIRWDRDQLPPSVFDARLKVVREAMGDAQALVVYSDVWRSNQARYLTNFMPYWNRSLAVIPKESAPILLCGLSPRVYPWIRSVTVFEEIRPAAKMIPALTQLCSEKGWTRVGVLDLDHLIQEFRVPLEASGLEVKPVTSPSTPDSAELAMRRSAAKLAREILERELPQAPGLSGHQFAGRLERAFRRAGAEDLVIAISSGETVPAPATASPLNEHSSVSVALEWSGHWVRVTRPVEQAHGLSLANLDNATYEELSGPYPYSAGSANASDMNPDAIYSIHIEETHNGRRLFYGDTCYQGKSL